VDVLEHLEDPLAFLRTLRAALTSGGKAFSTAALNAPNADHIYLYRKPEEVLRQLTAAGFALEESWLGAAYRPPALDLPVPLVAAFVVT
jgi:2-polyprenyl-3-methyl-5-hydroxy-6-metoxy-1,4-benzoquinol methylase